MLLCLKPLRTGRQLLPVCALSYVRMRLCLFCNESKDTCVPYPNLNRRGIITPPPPCNQPSPMAATLTSGSPVATASVHSYGPGTKGVIALFFVLVLVGILILFLMMTGTMPGMNLQKASGQLALPNLAASLASMDLTCNSVTAANGINAGGVITGSGITATTTGVTSTGGVTVATGDINVTAGAITATVGPMTVASNPVMTLASPTPYYINGNGAVLGGSGVTFNKTWVQ